MDIIQCFSSSPLYAIAHFWSTLQMNFVTPRGFCCAYPALTFDGRGLLNPKARMVNNQPKDFVKPLIAKYQERGFIMHQCACTIPLPPLAPLPPCGLHLSEYCPDTRRSFDDDMSFTLHFDTDDVPYHTGPNLISTEWTVGWKLGGYHGQRYSFGSTKSFNRVHGEVQTRCTFRRVHAAFEFTAAELDIIDAGQGNIVI